MTDDDTTTTGGADTDEQDGGLSRRGMLRGSAALGAAPVIASAAGAAEAAPGDGPRGIHVAHGAEPSSTLAVAFTGAAGSATIRYGPSDGDPGTADLDTTATPSGRPVPGRDAVAYTATLTGLAADTEYAYEVELNGTTSERYAARTAPVGPEVAADGFTVAHVADHGVADPENPFQRPDDANPELAMALAERQDPVMQLLSGDISYSNGNPSTWDLYFETHEDYYAGTPFMTVPGNHEAEVGTGMIQYDRRLNAAMPVVDPVIDPVSKRRWWDVVYGNTFIMGLNTTADACGDLARAEEFVPLYDPRCETEAGRTYGELQEAYMRSALARAEAREDVKWKIVQFHGPLWTTSPDHEPRRDLQKRWGPIFDEYDVDLVLHGDNHVWERSKPIRHTEDLLTYSERRRPRDRPDEQAPPPAEAAADLDLPFEDADIGTTFVVNGTGGVSHYELGADELYIDTAFESFYGVTRLDIDDEAIEVRYIAHPPLDTVTDDDGSLPAGFDPSLDNPAVAVRDAFRIEKTDDGRPRQVDLELPDGSGSSPPELTVSGSRSDDGQAFTGGATNHVELAVDASAPVTVRDRVPAAWDVVGGDIRSPHGDEPATAPDGRQYVYLDVAGGDDDGVVEADYFVEAPADADETGAYSFGPVGAARRGRGADRDWTTVPGTGSTEYVVGSGADPAHDVRKGNP